MQNTHDSGPWTIRRLLQWSSAYFSDHGIDSPRATAEILLAHTLKTERIRLYTAIDLPLNPAELDAYKQLLRRRIEREPVAYITGTREFWGLRLDVTPDVLIPRPETERLVEAVLEVLPAGDAHRPWRVLDLGTGSGAVVVALAHERPSHNYFASDVSTGAVRLARRNAQRHLAPGAIDFFAAHWLASLRPDALAMDVVVSNPPYIRSGDMPGLQPEVVRCEPDLALNGAADGLESYRTIVGGAIRHLRPGGYLLLEIGHDQRAEVTELADAVGGYDTPDCFSDYAGRDRVLRIRRSAAGESTGPTQAAK